MMARNIRLLIAYDGTRYQGWQRQKESPTIQGAIENVLQKITQASVNLAGAGRTDAGVHAWGQVANFKTATTLPLAKMESALRALLPPDILIREILEVEPDFHARYSSESKIYDYFITHRKPHYPFFRHYVWSIQDPLALPLIKTGLLLLRGKKDFSSFQSAGSPVNNPIRTIYQADLLPAVWGTCRFRFKADGFLRHMVRNMVGLLVQLGLRRITLNEFEAVIQAKDRSKAGAMAPAHGLFLRKVNYPKIGPGIKI
jgi:tRNA pseudouridine38-40 synthase